MKFGNGRPRKYSTPEERNIALGYLSAKHREPWLTQEQYAKNYGITPRTLRRYIDDHAAAEAIKIKQERLETLKKSLKINVDNDDADIDPPKGKGGLIIAWT